MTNTTAPERVWTDEERDEILNAGWARHNKHMRRSGASGQLISEWDHPEAHVLAEAEARISALIAEAVEAERALCQEIAAEFVHRRLYKRQAPAGSYHSREIAAAMSNPPDREECAARLAIRTQTEGQSHE